MFQHQEDGQVLFETGDFISMCNPAGVYTVHDVNGWVCMRASILENACTTYVWLLLYGSLQGYHSILKVYLVVLQLLHKLALYTHPNLQLIESQCFLVTALHKTY